MTGEAFRCGLKKSTAVQRPDTGEPASADAAHAPPSLLHQVSRGIFWNTALLPLVSVSGILLSVLVRRSFGLESGYYDAALGIANSILFYTSLGLSGSLPRFIPELQLTAGRHAAMQLIARLGTIRVAVAAAVVLVVGVWAEPLARVLDLGSNGPAYLRLLSALLIGRAALDFAYRALDSVFQQVRVNTLSLIHGLLDVALVALVVLLGLGMTGVIAALGASAVVMAIVAAAVVVRHLGTLPRTARTQSVGTLCDHASGSSRPSRLSGTCRSTSQHLPSPARSS